MDKEHKIRKAVPEEQLSGLLDFLKEHQNLAKGVSRRGNKHHALKLWNMCAKKINSIKGVTKDGKGWSKYWYDWKYRTKKRAMEIRAAKESGKPLPEGLTPMEVVIISIIGESTINDIVIKVDPLGDGDYAEETDMNDVSENLYYDNTRSFKRSKRLEGSDLVGAGPSSSKHKQRKIHQSDEDEDYSDEDTLEYQFLQLEKERLNKDKIMVQSLQTIATQVSRIADTIQRIGDGISFRLNGPLN